MPLAQVNKAVHSAVGPDLQKLAKEKHGTAKAGHVYTVELPRTCDLRSVDRVRWIINVLGAAPLCAQVGCGAAYWTTALTVDCPQVRL